MSNNYIIIAVKGLETSGHRFSWEGSYFVDSTADLGRATLVARAEVFSRGGKYGCVVYTTSVINGTELLVITRNRWSEFRPDYEKLINENNTNNGNNGNI